MAIRNTQAHQNVSARAANKARSSEPKASKHPVELIDDVNEARDGTVTTIRQKDRRKSFLAKATGVLSNEKLQTQKEKVTLLSAAKQKLAMADGLYKAGLSKAEEAETASAEAANSLYQARAKNIASFEEITALLGDVFGFRKKGDANSRVDPGSPDASATPFGKGEYIRKRVIRLTKTREYLSTGRGDRFFSSVPEENAEEFQKAISEITKRLDAGEISPFTAYDQIANARKEALGDRQTIPPAFDPKKVAAMVEALRAPDALKKLEANEALAAAYDSLFEAMNMLLETE